MYPQKTIPANGGVGLWQSESQGFMTGTEGTAKYSVGAQSQDTITFYWDNPYVGSNRYNESSSNTAYTVSRSKDSGDGDNTQVYFVVKSSLVSSNASDPKAVNGAQADL